MNPLIKVNIRLLNAHVLIALSLLIAANQVNAACVDDGAGTITCSGTTGNNNTDAAIVGNVILDSTGGPVEFNNTGTDPILITIPDTGSGETMGTVIKSSSNTVESASTFSVIGNNPVVINNVGANIIMDGSSRTFNPAGWTNDVNGLLYNDAVLVGFAAAISAINPTQSLTVVNQTVDNGIYIPDPYYITGVPAQINASGPLSAAIYTNSSIFNLSGTGVIFGGAATYGGANYTAPSVLDGTQFATVNSAGLTVIDFSNGGGLIGDVKVLDRNPLLTQAQAADPSLVLAYGPDDVGPRNSVITLGGPLAAIAGNVYLGSGAHVMNITGATVSGEIVVDQRDSDVVSVVGGVATTLYKVHGDRTFTLNYDGEGGSYSAVGLGNIIINDVVGSVNNVNVKFDSTNYFPNNFTANGVGSNTLSLIYRGELGQGDGSSNPGTNHTGSILGFNTLNLSGGSIQLSGQYNILGNININSGVVVLPGGAFGITTNLIADNVVVNNGASLITNSSFYSVNNKIGDITGNLINNGYIFLGDATLDVDGNVTLNSGSTVRIDAGPLTMGQINATGTTTIASDAIIIPRVKLDALVHQGDSYVIATNANGIPIIDNQKGLLQWVPSIGSGDLILTAIIGVPSNLLPKVSQAASNAVDTFFSIAGNADGTDALSILQTTLIQPDISDKTLERVAERLRPEINDGGIRMLLGNSDKLFNLIDARLLDTAIAKKHGVELDETLAASKGIWVQGFGDRGTQGERKGVDGYGMSAVGMSMGIDKVLDANDYTRVGLAAGYARSNTTNNGDTVNNRIDMNSFMGAVYASRAWDDWYLNGLLGLGRHTYETRRQLFEHTAIGRHDSWQLNSRLDAGFPMQLDDAFTFIPMVSLNYSHIKESGYKENGVFSQPLYDTSIAPTFPLVINGIDQFALLNSPINLQIEGRTFDSIRGGIGGKGIYTLQDSGWSADIELHGMLTREFGDLAQDSNARFVAGGNSFKSPGIQPARNTLLAGGKVNLTTDDEQDQLSLIASYDAEMRSEYFGQTVALTARYDFDQAPRYVKAASAYKAKMLAKKVPDQLVTATEKDINDIQQAMQPGDLELDDANTPVTQAVGKAISNWLNALTNKNLDVYFASYAANFVNADGSNRQQWERKRKSEINKASNAVVNVSYLTIKPNGDKAMAVFTETSTENSQQIAMQKIVDLENRNGRWLIVREDAIALQQ